VDVSLITFLFLLLQFIVVAVTINCIEFVVLLLIQQMGQEALFSGCSSVCACIRLFLLACVHMCIWAKAFSNWLATDFWFSSVLHQEID